jgi:hypothetical protein
MEAADTVFWGAAGTADDTFTGQQYREFICHLKAKDSLAATRDCAIFTHLYANVGRADEGRLLYLADIMPPRVITCIGRVSFPVLPTTVSALCLG